MTINIQHIKSITFRLFFSLIMFFMMESMTAQTKRALVIGISEYEKTNDNAWGVIHGANDADLIISILKNGV